MLYILTETELADARNHLAEQLRDETTIATAKSVVLDALREAIDELSEETAASVVRRSHELAKAHWQKFPPGPVRHYFEQISCSEPKP